jgi:hypothetical protein
MTQTTQQAIEALSALRLPELQARYAELLGEPTRCPNKKWLIKTITAALQRQEAEPEPEPETASQPVATKTKRPKPTVDELRSRYLEVVGRPTESTDAAYLRWKISQAEKGKVPVGPISARRSDSEPADVKVLPLRMDADLVTKLDEARERLGLKSRMELFRLSLHAYLQTAGEAEVAALFAPEA